MSLCFDTDSRPTREQYCWTCGQPLQADSSYIVCADCGSAICGQCPRCWCEDVGEQELLEALRQAMPYLADLAHA